MDESIVIFGSYNKGPEYMDKMEKVKELRAQGLNVSLYYLLALTPDDNLPDRFVHYLIEKNIEKAIKLFNPTVLAFHNGLTLMMKNSEFKMAIEKIRPRYPDMKFLLEHLNQPDKGYNFKQNYGFLPWCQRHFIDEHELYSVLWK